jgi:hypothetical protein
MMSMEFRANKSWWLLGVGMMLGAGVVYAANPAYDEAKANITKANALLAAIQPAANEKPGEAHQRKRAIKALERAKIRIACAQAIADGGKPGCPAAHERFDDNDDDDDRDRGHGHGHKSHKDRDDADKKKRDDSAEKKRKEEADKKEADEKKKKESAGKAQK